MPRFATRTANGVSRRSVDDTYHALISIWVYHSFLRDTNALLPGGTTKRNYAKYNRDETKKTESPMGRRVNCSALLGMPSRR